MPFRAVLLAIVFAGALADQAVVSDGVGGSVAGLCHPASKRTAGTGDPDAQCVVGTNDECLDDNEDNALLQERLAQIQLLQNRLLKSKKMISRGVCHEACEHVKDEHATCIAQCKCESVGSGDCDALAMKKEIKFMNQIRACATSVEVDEHHSGLPESLAGEYTITNKVPFLSRPIYVSQSDTYIFWLNGSWRIGEDYATSEGSVETEAQGACPGVGEKETFGIVSNTQKFTATLSGTWIGEEQDDIPSVQYHHEDLYIFAIAHEGHVKMLGVSSNGTRLGNKYYTLPQSETSSSAVTPNGFFSAAINYMTPEQLEEYWDSPTGDNIANEAYNISNIERVGRVILDLEEGFSLKIISAKGLKDFDAAGGSVSDPYVIVYINGTGGREELCRTPYLMNNLEPKFYMTCWTDDVYSSVEFHVIDKDFHKADDLMGVYTWTRDQGGFIAESQDLVLDGQGGQGELRLTIVPAAEREALLDAAR